ncbi:hypothetical protein BJX99DRAFT_265606 [Aspergillus californicus]
MFYYLITTIVGMIIPHILLTTIIIALLIPSPSLSKTRAAMILIMILITFLLSVNYINSYQATGLLFFMPFSVWYSLSNLPSDNLRHDPEGLYQEIPQDLPQDLLYNPPEVPQDFPHDHPSDLLRLYFSHYLPQALYPDIPQDLLIFLTSFLTTRFRKHPLTWSLVLWKMRSL